MKPRTSAGLRRMSFVRSAALRSGLATMAAMRSADKVVAQPASSASETNAATRCPQAEVNGLAIGMAAPVVWGAS